MTRIAAKRAIAILGVLTTSCTGLALSSSWFQEVRSTFLGKPIEATIEIPNILELTEEDVALRQKENSEAYKRRRSFENTRHPERNQSVFSPFVRVAKTVMGGGILLNKVRVKVIRWTSGRNMEASESPTYLAGLERFFQSADTDQNGTICEGELAITVRSLGFWWLRDSQIKELFVRADKNSNGSISFEEFVQETPKALLARLAK